jgi:cysteine-rich repeat protein
MSPRQWLSAPMLIAFTAAGCTSGSTSQSFLDPSIVECSNGPDECPKIEDDEIGTDGVTLEVDGTVVTFLSFQAKEDDEGYIGFTLDTAASFIVKAGNTCYAGEGTSWIHPAGTSGPDAHAISNIQVCSVEEPEPSCGDGTVDEGEECDDGNNDDGDTCSANCTIEVPPPECGNGVVEPGEQCDDGNTDDHDTCTNDCFIITA